MSRSIYYVFGDTGAVRYVGCSVNPRKRLREHIQETRMLVESGVGLYAFQQWLAAEQAAGRGIHVCTVRPAALDWRRDEQTEITRLLDAGVPLLNVETTDGGKVRRNARVHCCHPASGALPHAVIDLRFPVTPEEHADIEQRAGSIGIAAFLRKLLGLPPRRRGRPPGQRPPPGPRRK